MGQQNGAKNCQNRETGFGLRRLVLLLGTCSLLAVLGAVVLAGNPPPPPPPPPGKVTLTPGGVRYVGAAIERHVLEEDCGAILYRVGCTDTDGAHSLSVSGIGPDNLEYYSESDHNYESPFDECGYILSPTDSDGIAITGICSAHGLSDSGTLVVMKTDLDVAGLSDLDEETEPGRYLPRNSGPYSVSLSLVPEGLPDTHTVNLFWSGNLLMSLDPQMNQPLDGQGALWAPGTQPATVYLWAGDTASAEYVSLDYYAGGGKLTFDWAYVTTVGGDLYVQSLAENEEDDPGKYIGVNDDDDNCNGVPDMEDTYIEDNDMRFIKIIETWPGVPEGETVTLQLTWPGSLKIYETPGKAVEGYPTQSTEITSGKTYDHDDLTEYGTILHKYLYVEGVEAEETTVTLTYTHGASGVVHTDTAKFNVFGVDIDAEGVPDKDELLVGALIGVNNDDDDQDDLVDMNEGQVSYDNDLLPLSLDVQAYGPTTGDTVAISWPVDANIRLFTGGDRTGSVARGTEYSPEALPDTMYVEGFGYENKAVITLQYLHDNVVIHEDNLAVTVFAADLDAQGLADPYEQFEGKFVGVNDDDDNGNGQEDYADTESAGIYEDDFVVLEIMPHSPDNLYDTDTLTLTWSTDRDGVGENRKLKIYESILKKDALGESSEIYSGKSYQLSELGPLQDPTILYAEAFEPGVNYIFLTYRRNGVALHRDVVKVVAVQFKFHWFYADHYPNKKMYVGYNNDDDDKDGVMDAIDTHVVGSSYYPYWQHNSGAEGDNDFQVLTVTYNPGYTDACPVPDTHCLSITWGGVALYKALETDKWLNFQNMSASYGEDSAICALNSFLAGQIAFLVEGTSVGEGYVTLEYYYGGELIYADTMDVRCVETDASSGVEAPFEENPGKLIYLNDDDDDSDGVIDMEDDQVTGENDLCQVGLNVLTGNDFAKVELAWTGEQKIRVFTGADHTGEIFSGQRYDTDAVPSYIYVEAVKPSEHQCDIALVIRYWHQVQMGFAPEARIPEQRIHEDVVMFTAMAVDLEASGLDERDEMNPGAFVRLNSDDDDLDSVADNVDTDGVTGEDDLMTLSIQPVMPVTQPDTDTVELIWSGVKIYSTATKLDGASSSELTSPESFTLSQLPLDLYIEGAASGSGAINLMYMNVGDTVSVSVASPVSVDLDASGIADGEELTIGLRLMSNKDDDDSDALLDDVDSNVVGGDNDLYVITIQDPLPSTLPDTHTVSLNWSGNIRVYETNTKWNADTTSQVASGVEYELSELPLTLYVEGSAAGNDLLTLEYEDSATGVCHRDNLKTTTPVANIMFSGVSDGEEETEGAFLARNIDEDWEDFTGDNDEVYGVTSSIYDSLSRFDNDLVRFYISSFPAGTPECDKVELSWTPSTKILVWSTDTIPLNSWPVEVHSGATYDADNIPREFLVSGAGASSSVRDTTLTVKYKIGETVISEDVVKATVVEVDMDAEGVEEEDEYCYWRAGEVQVPFILGQPQVPDVLTKVTIYDPLPANLSDTDTVSVTWTFPPRINVYEFNAGAYSEISSGQEYSLSQLPKDLYVKSGYGSDGFKGVIRAEYAHGDDEVLVKDVISLKTLPFIPEF